MDEKERRRGREDDESLIELVAAALILPPYLAFTVVAAAALDLQRFVGRLAFAATRTLSFLLPESVRRLGAHFRPLARQASRMSGRVLVLTLWLPLQILRLWASGAEGASERFGRVFAGIVYALRMMAIGLASRLAALPLVELVAWPAVAAKRLFCSYGKTSYT